MSFLRIILLSCIIFLTCQSSHLVLQRKMDAELRKRIQTQNDIHFSGECAEKITSEIQIRIEKSGVAIQSVSGRFFTAMGSPKQIQTLARQKTVIRLEASPAFRYKPEKEKI